MTPLTVSFTCQFHAYSGVSVSATMEFEAGEPVQFGLVTLASDPWISGYPS